MNALCDLNYTDTTLQEKKETGTDETKRVQDKNNKQI